MARIETDPNYTAPTFSRATAATDLFKKEDVQKLAEAMSGHDHSTGKGAALVAGSIPAGSITSGMIADGTIVAGDIADGAVTSAKILDGTIATGDLAAGAVTNAKLAADTARANLLVNPGFRVWQRGAGPITTGYTADRWFIGAGAGSSISVTRVQDGTGPAADLQAMMLRVVYTHGSAESSIYQNIVMADNDLRGQTVTFAAWLRSTVATTTRLRVVSDGSGAQDIYVPVTLANTWQRLTATIVLPTNATFFFVQMTMGASCTASITDATLVVGSVAADYAPLHPADDLARCHRYYESHGGNAQWPGVTGYAATTGQFARAHVSFHVKKALAPTMTVNGPWTSSANCATPTIPASGMDGYILQATPAAAGHFYTLSDGANQTIVAEANP